MLYTTGVSGPLWPFKIKLESTQPNYKLSSLVTLARTQVFNSHMGLAAAIMGGTGS